MSNEIQQYLNNTFKNVPKTRASIELKEELLANSTERYNDLINEGYEEQDAINVVINSIGDITHLLKELEKENITEDTKIYSDRKKSALNKTIALALYIAGFVFLLKSTFDGDALTGLIGMILIYIFPTCLIVYSLLAYPKPKRTDQTIVEEFKEWNSTHKNMVYIRNLIIVILWLLIFILYFLISFLTDMWEITWILFLVAACATGIIILIFKLKETNE